MNSLDDIKEIFSMQTIAVVGMSPKPERPSHYVSMYMKEQGYNIIPVNPGHNEISGIKCYPSLEEIIEPVDIVDVFRRSEYVVPLAESAINIKAKALLLQDGVINHEAAELASKSGLIVIMDDCMLRKHREI